MKENHIYLEMVRYALNPEVGMPKGMEHVDWEDLFQFADEQAIMGVMFEGVKRILEGQGAGEREQEVMDVVMEWAIVAHQIEEQNKRVNEAAMKVTRTLKRNGYESCILKGQGNGLYYPNPYLRNPGDIDVWVRSERLWVRGYRLLRGKKSKVREVIRFVKSMNPGAKAVYHHIDGGACDGVEVEVHYRPSFIFNPVHNRRLQQWFEKMAPQQFAHEEELPHNEDAEGTDFKVCVPTAEFNVVFLLSHVYNHLLHEGIGLRQIIDYYYLLCRGEMFEIRGEKWKETFRYLGMEKIAGAVMWVLNEILGLEERFLIAPKDEKLGRVLLEEILRGGNFGKYDTDNIKADNPLKKNWQRIKRDIRMMRYFPSECLWEPMFRVWHFFWRRLMN